MLLACIILNFFAVELLGAIIASKPFGSSIAIPQEMRCVLNVTSLYFIFSLEYCTPACGAGK